MNKIIGFVIVVLLSSTNISISAERDCSNPKGFHQKLMCKKFNSKLKMPTLPKIGGNKTENSETGIVKRLKAKTLKDMFFPKAD